MLIGDIGVLYPQELNGVSFPYIAELFPVFNHKETIRTPDIFLNGLLYC